MVFVIFKSHFAQHITIEMVNAQIAIMDII